MNRKKNKLSFIFDLFISIGKVILVVALSSSIFILFFFYFQISGFYKYKVPVSGASMLPTLPETGKVEFLRFFNVSNLPDFLLQKIQRGDIVVFENNKTDYELKKQSKSSSGFVKRVVGVAGDIVKIENGFLEVNGEKVAEEYILKPRSTFGGRTIKDCIVTKVPEDKIFVLGDNRKISMDSRQIGLVSISDIEFYIPYKDQQERFKKNWRDTSSDLTTENSSLFDTKKYVNILNSLRRQNNLPLLRYEPRLERSAYLRAEAILKNNEYGSRSTSSKYSIEDALADASYSNIVYGEFPMFGYYDEQELYDVFMEQKEAKDFLLNKNYEDIGVSTFIGETNGCPVQIVVQHLAGYVPPNYTQLEKNNWRDALTNLRNVQNGWESLKNYDGFYEKNKLDVDRINEIISLRLQRIEQISNKINSNLWLSEEEKKWIEEDEVLGAQQNDLATKLNSSQ
jgi:signal peptidase I